jgi:hypothetical protein
MVISAIDILVVIPVQYRVSSSFFVAFLPKKGAEGRIPGPARPSHGGGFEGGKKACETPVRKLDRPGEGYYIL